uniref:Uncharacterized protein n=1 Tax=Rhizophora mucronata TaxID=61149 RepID=A0A2P2QZ77_RHIMU
MRERNKINCHNFIQYHRAPLTTNSASFNIHHESYKLPNQNLSKYAT